MIHIISDQLSFKEPRTLAVRFQVEAGYLTTTLTSSRFNTLAAVFALLDSKVSLASPDLLSTLSSLCWGVKLSLITETPPIHTTRYWFRSFGVLLYLSPNIDCLVRISKQSLLLTTCRTSRPSLSLLPSSPPQHCLSSCQSLPAQLLASRQGQRKRKTHT